MGRSDIANMPNITLPTKGRLKTKLKEWQRVVKLARKPRRQEFNNVAKITGLGIVLVGIIAFFIKLASFYASNVLK